MIHLRLLGSVDLLNADGTPLDAVLRRPKAMAVLAYLAAARPRGFHRRDKIAALFWPELSTDRARAALRSTLTRLRDDLGDGAILTRGAEEIAIDAEAIGCDVVALDDALETGRAMDAAALYRGELLDGFHADRTSEELEQWISAERERIRRDLLDALVRCAHAEDERGDRVAALAAARRAVEIAPHEETAARLVMSLSLAAGDRGTALRTFEDLSQRLQREFDIAPSAATHAVVDRARSTVVPRDDVHPAVPDLAPARKPAPAGPVSRTAPRRIRRKHVLSAATLVVALIGGTAAVTRSRAASAVVATTPTWSMIKFAAGPMPHARISTAAVLDSTGDGLIVFGGLDYGGDPSNSTISNELWSLRGLRTAERATWARLAPPGAPPAPRTMVAIANDAAHDRLIMHGGALGMSAPCANDTWVLNHVSGLDAAPEWQRVAIHGPLPPPRADMRLVYDAGARRAIFFGGHDCVSVFSHDLWALDFDDSTLTSGRWRELDADTSAGVPRHRVAYAAAFDSSTNRLYVHGGNSSGVISGDLWVLEHATGAGGRPAWRPLNCRGTPPVRAGHSGAYDAASDSWVLFGGIDRTLDLHRDLWRVSGLRGGGATCRWESLGAPEYAPGARASTTGMFDARSHALFFFGGEYQGTAFKDVWVLTDPFGR